MEPFRASAKMALGRRWQGVEYAMSAACLVGRVEREPHRARRVRRIEHEVISVLTGSGIGCSPRHTRMPQQTSAHRVLGCRSAGVSLHGDRLPPQETGDGEASGGGVVRRVEGGVVRELQTQTQRRAAGS